MKYALSKKIPEKLSAVEAVVTYPDFQEEIAKTKAKAGKTKLTTANYLRAIFVEIGFRYDELFNAYTSVKVDSEVGIAYSSSEDISKILVKILKRDCPALIEKILADEVKKIPRDVKVVYFIADDLTGSKAFTDNGIEMIQRKDIPTYLGHEPKKETKSKPKSEDEV